MALPNTVFPVLSSYSRTLVVFIQIHTFEWFLYHIQRIGQTIFAVAVGLGGILLTALAPRLRIRRCTIMILRAISSILPSPSIVLILLWLTYIIIINFHN